MLNRYTLEWKGLFLGFRARYEGVIAVCSQDITAITQGICLSSLWNISRFGGNYFMFHPLWHPSWVMYWLPFLIYWKTGCSIPVQVPFLDVSCLCVVLLGPPNLEPLWDTAKQFRSTSGTAWHHPLQKSLSSLWITLKMYCSTKDVRHKCVIHVSLPSIALIYDWGTLYFKPYAKIQFLLWTFSVHHSCWCPAGVLFLPKQDVFVVCNFSVLLTETWGVYKIKYGIAENHGTGKFNYFIPLWGRGPSDDVGEAAELGWVWEWGKRNSERSLMQLLCCCWYVKESSKCFWENVWKLFRK